jgi:hypothetical protein
MSTLVADIYDHVQINFLKEAVGFSFTKLPGLCVKVTNFASKKF